MMILGFMVRSKKVKVKRQVKMEREVECYGWKHTLSAELPENLVMGRAETRAERWRFS